jgi:hypothetical protein
MQTIAQIIMLIVAGIRGSAVASIGNTQMRKIAIIAQSTTKKISNCRNHSKEKHKFRPSYMPLLQKEPRATGEERGAKFQREEHATGK